MAAYTQATAQPVAELAQRRHRLGPVTKDILFGSIAGMMSKIIEHPFDLIKVRLQTQPLDPAHYAGAMDCFRKILHSEGMRGLFRGVSMPLFGATLEDASLFVTYNQTQRALRFAFFPHAPADMPLPMGYLAVAAAASGAVTGVVLTPIELIKCKMQVQMMSPRIDQHGRPTAPPSAPSLIRSVYREGGVRGLWLGLSGTLLRETGGGVAWFLSFEIATRKFLQLRHARDPSAPPLTKKELTSLELMTAGAIAGMCYNVSLFPADSVKSMMQTERELRAHAHPVVRHAPGFLATFMRIYRTRGVVGLYAGVGITCLRSAPSSGLVFLIYNKLEQAADRYGF
ncbi:mitochondrial ornithine carrier protein [Malassezia sp. CBS 17886]|nr:mitochondrial ornithine carrier protein [Malassezia sp. CBS 17886]